MSELDAIGRRTIAVTGAGSVGLVIAVGLAQSHRIDFIETDTGRRAARR